jgi:hypothetical protein
MNFRTEIMKPMLLIAAANLEVRLSVAAHS